MKNDKKVSSYDWRFRFAVFFLILSFLFLFISLILIPTASFINPFNVNLGNGFWALKYYGLKDLLFNWRMFDDQAIFNLWNSHPFLQVFVALLFLLFLFPLFLILGSILLLRWWMKTRI